MIRQFNKHHWLALTVVIALLCLTIPLFFSAQTPSLFEWYSSRIPAPPEVAFKSAKVHEHKAQSNPDLTEQFYVVTIDATKLPSPRVMVSLLQEKGFPAFYPEYQTHYFGKILVGPELSLEEATKQMNQLPPEVRDQARVVEYKPEMN